MAERFEKLYELPGNLYSEGSPVILSAGVLLKDTQSGKIIVQLKFQSVSSIVIKAIKVAISAYDISGQEISRIQDYQYLDLNIHNGFQFGANRAILLPNPISRSFSINRITAVLTDGSVNEIAMPLEKLPSAVVLQTKHPHELVKQYRIEINNNVKFIPHEENSLWMCCCGTWNSGESCTGCMATKVKVFSVYKSSEILEKMEARIAQEKLAAEESAEKEQITVQKLRKKITIAAAIILPIILAYTLVTQWIYPKIIIPGNTYSEAEELLLKGQYSDAEALFSSLGGFRDASDRAKEAHDLVLNEQEEKLKLSEEKIQFASSLLRREFDGNNVIITQEEMDFVTGDVELFGYIGKFYHGYTAKGSQKHTLDLMYWTTNKSVDYYSDISSQMISLYGENYSIEPEPYKKGSNANVWRLNSGYNWIGCWQNSNGTVTIQWTVDIS